MKRRYILPPLVVFFVLASLQFRSQARQDPVGSQPPQENPPAQQNNAGGNFFQGAERELAIRSQERLEEIQERHAKKIMALPGVISIGIGLDKETRQLIYVVTVDKDKPMPEVPAQIEGVHVRVEQGEKSVPLNGGQGCKPCHSNLTDYPVECGNSFSANQCIACSMGFKAYKKDNGDAEWLTNAHCQIGTNNCPGDKALESPNFHPAMADRSVLGLCITIPIDSKNVGFTRGIILEDKDGRNLDAAMIGSGDDAVSRSVRDIGVPSTIPGTVMVGDIVQKSGRTTGLTKGDVVVTNLSFSLQYECKGSLAFSGIIQCKVRDECSDPPCVIAMPGDSGSGVFSTGSPPRVVGLLFAGNTGFQRADFSQSNACSMHSISCWIPTTQARASIYSPTRRSVLTQIPPLAAQTLTTDCRILLGIVTTTALRATLRQGVSSPWAQPVFTAHLPKLLPVSILPSQSLTMRPQPSLLTTSPCRQRLTSVTPRSLILRPLSTIIAMAPAQRTAHRQAARDFRSGRRLSTARLRMQQETLVMALSPLWSRTNRVQQLQLQPV